ncbi:hypothetical protein H3H36_14480 [Duganella sp. FT3S]|uniref:Uncharacterized protein n=1 Tax=Rugamonas fusca TaxID=2758568 RepID=A0A7W2I7L7_9BURK|nr:hypothetical protein [Rugamonas fusca]MBA5606560.1 hypothetical protein [Rugamonas fusca]
MKNEVSKVEIVEVKADEQAVSELLSIEELETRLEMVAASCSRCCANSSK